MQTNNLDVTMEEENNFWLDLSQMKKYNFNIDDIIDHKSTESSVYKTEEEVQKVIRNHLENRLTEVRKTSPIMLRENHGASHNHDANKMVNFAMAALKAIKYDKKITGLTMFEEKSEFNGWNFVMRKIF